LKLTLLESVGMGEMYVLVQDTNRKSSTALLSNYKMVIFTFWM